MTVQASPNNLYPIANLSGEGIVNTARTAGFAGSFRGEAVSLVFGERRVFNGRQGNAAGHFV
jgi:hypothetical protein